MSLPTLGRRYERLLVFAAPLTLASVVTLFVVFATSNQQERSTARCYEASASLLDIKRSQIDEAWASYTRDKRTTTARIEYVRADRTLTHPAD